MYFGAYKQSKEDKNVLHTIYVEFLVGVWCTLDATKKYTLGQFFFEILEYYLSYYVF